MSNDSFKKSHTLDLLKGLMMILILISHTITTLPTRLKYLFPFYIDLSTLIFVAISGYVYSKSLERNDVHKLSDYYNLKTICSKLVRYLLPFTFVYIIEMITYYVRGTHLSLILLIKNYIAGGVGPGSYYIPLMVQIVIVFPLFYFLIKKYDIEGLIISFFINALYDVSVNIFSMDVGLYRILFMRYFFIIALGCYSAIGKKKPNTLSIVLCVLIGGIFIYLIQYKNYFLNIIPPSWKGTCYLICIFVIPFVLIIFNKEISFKPIELIGKASYNIFLLQMPYFQFFNKPFVELIPNNRYRAIFNVVFCCLIGIAYYYIEDPITKKIVKKIKNK